MKRISPIFLFVLVLFSCGKGKNPNPIATVVPSRAGFADSSEKLGFNPSNDLEIQIPMSNEQLKKWIPEKVGEMEQRKLIVGHKQGMEMSGAIATYQENGQEGKQISMEVLDGAGPTGSVMLKSIKQKLIIDYDEEMNSGFSRIYERDGTRVWEKVDTDHHHSEIEFVLKNRYHFIFKGNQIEMEELWTFVKEVRKQMG
jgi:hypothetical protein